MARGKTRHGSFPEDNVRKFTTKIGNAKNLTDLDTLWKDEGPEVLQVDDMVKKAYEKKKKELQVTWHSRKKKKTLDRASTKQLVTTRQFPKKCSVPFCKKYNDNIVVLFLKTNNKFVSRLAES